MIKWMAAAYMSGWGKAVSLPPPHEYKQDYDNRQNVSSERNKKLFLLLSTCKINLPWETCGPNLTLSNMDTCIP